MDVKFNYNHPVKHYFKLLWRFDNDLESINSGYKLHVYFTVIDIAMIINLFIFDIIKFRYMSFLYFGFGENFVLRLISGSGCLPALQTKHLGQIALETMDICRSKQ